MSATAVQASRRITSDLLRAIAKNSDATLPGAIDSALARHARDLSPDVRARVRAAALQRAAFILQNPSSDDLDSITLQQLLERKEGTCAVLSNILKQMADTRNNLTGNPKQE
ncbi:MAG TPA: hypothetical protein VM100_10005 [Longimicrobiales bacterium]|nr:hypothetical protein [Longimicrobiales bacterium]